MDPSHSYGSSEAMLDMITDLQSERIDSQRAELRPPPTAPEAPTPAPAPAPAPETPAPEKKGKGASLPGLRHQHTLSDKPEDDFLDMIARVQGSRLESQRTAMPPRAVTVPDDDFFALLMRAQATRMEDQRATIPIQTNRDNKNGSNSKK